MRAGCKEYDWIVTEQETCGKFRCSIMFTSVEPRGGRPSPCATVNLTGRLPPPARHGELPVVHEYAAADG
jgi:hypothetical protein